jgi:transposase InsO family protein
MSKHLIQRLFCRVWFSFHCRLNAPTARVGSRNHPTWLYAAFMLDLFSRKIVGFALDDTMAQSLTIAALQMAIHNRHPD